MNKGTKCEIKTPTHASGEASFVNAETCAQNPVSRERFRIIMERERKKTSNARFGLSNYGSSQVGQVGSCLVASPVIGRLTQKASRKVRSSTTGLASIIRQI